MEVRCNCGKVFRNVHALGGHKRFCFSSQPRTVGPTGFESEMDQVVSEEGNVYNDETQEEGLRSSTPFLYNRDKMDPSQLRYINFQRELSKKTPITSLKAGHNKQIGSPDRVVGDMYNYLEVVNYVESVGLSSDDGSKLIDLVKWLTHSAGNEISLPSEYRYLKAQLLKSLKYRSTYDFYSYLPL